VVCFPCFLFDPVRRNYRFMHDEAMRHEDSSDKG